MAKNVFWRKMPISPKEGVLHLCLLLGRFILEQCFLSILMFAENRQEGGKSRQ
jgi:hypothetical protein